MMAECTTGCVSTLSGTTLAKAVRELNEPESDEVRLQIIAELRRRLEAWKPKDPDEEGVTLTRLDEDNFLLRFLRAKKFDVNRAEQLCVNYYKFRHKHSCLLGDLTPEAAQKVCLRMGHFISLVPRPFNTINTWRFLFSMCHFLKALYHAIRRNEFLMN